MAEIYLLDTNALAALRPEQRASSFVKSRCRISAEVLHEAQGYPDHRALTALEYPVHAGVLACVSALPPFSPLQSIENWKYSPIFHGTLAYRAERAAMYRERSTVSREAVSAPVERSTMTRIAPARASLMARCVRIRRPPARSTEAPPRP